MTQTFSQTHKGSQPHMHCSLVEYEEAAKCCTPSQTAHRAVIVDAGVVRNNSHYGVCVDSKQMILWRRKKRNQALSNAKTLGYFIYCQGTLLSLFLFLLNSFMSSALPLFEKYRYSGCMYCE
jgi:hypothetical protein